MQRSRRERVKVKGSSYKDFKQTNKMIFLPLRMCKAPDTLRLSLIVAGFPLVAYKDLRFELSPFNDIMIEIGPLAS